MKLVVHEQLTAIGSYLILLSTPAGDDLIPAWESNESRSSGVHTSNVVCAENCGPSWRYSFVPVTQTCRRAELSGRSKSKEWFAPDARSRMLLCEMSVVEEEEEEDAN
jgi:hypothetical protein